MKSSLSGKKSQFYMFAAVILVTAIFFVTSNKSTINLNEIENLNNYQNNYLYEGNIVLNNAILYNKNISDELKNFTTMFISYAASKDLEIGVVFMYAKDNQLHIVNYLNEPVFISPDYLVINPETELVQGFQERVEILYKNESYGITFSPYDIKLKTLFMKE